ncbi:P-loop containing nucleoside triphosphate hydrolase protein [Hypoxylon trugodes]|uniref:P-loop containing nucleoside triphosphate hydrolase protein n=1 Tax=Hypoxylon trugodes TaxID=326681 RepID=UPI00218E9E60|nr:P-loop containing nucleoside triphosphate hydrolase protein [Hypoxylon trugodes]KAI1393134.1 P-loop containing nucleoside triphosphate hydrolase protein [Hypoxylon trugodes]
MVPISTVIMGDNGDNTDINSKKLHPFFAVNHPSQDNSSNTITPVTPDPSCSPDSVDNDTNDANPSPPSDRRKRKRGEADDTQDIAPQAPDSKPQKVLKLNRSTGTIGSPPKLQPTKNKNTRRGRKPKAFIALMRYGQDKASRLRIGNRINEILASTQVKGTSCAFPNTPPSGRDNDERFNDAREVAKQGKKKSKNCAAKETVVTGQASNKPTHPFFQGKAKPDTVAEEKPKASAPKRKVFFSSTPGSSKTPRLAITPKFNPPALGANSNILRVPGAKHPAWPSKETAHVRGDIPAPLGLDESSHSEHLIRRRRAKGQQVRVAESESILRHAALQLNLNKLTEEMKAYDNDEFQPPPPILRIPSRYFESGKKLQARISGELRTLRQSGNTPKTHPAITHAFNSIANGLSAFDRTTCETSAWTQKYAPSSAERVLQNGREAELLRDWLENLKVQAVDTGTVDPGTKPKSSAPAKGKSKRKKKLDGFIISSDEEGYELDELSDVEGDWSSGNHQGSAKKTVVRSSSRRTSGEGRRFANAVVLSGPHGCGKTAAVYAIAKEMDFEVFEINSGSRRNGKDILEKVGDMTRNHLVQHHNKEKAPQDGVIPEDEVNQDIKSGKQGMMTAFFKPTPTTAEKPSKKSTEPPNAKDPKKPTKAQKQSLILLEEVDVLYEEDKQFWATVISMISQSKRPFVMTCNEEALVPLQNLNLHGIFRFSSPPRELAVDLLLSIAANEGHALRRHAIDTLYDSRGQDLRASIAELNYWCQIGVGDIQGGFNWFYPRWPKGKDVDEDGNTIRVVSQDTYQTGMGWLSRDSAVDGSSFRSSQEELYQQLCENWSLDTYEPLPSNDSSYKAKMATAQYSASDRLRLLDSIDSFASFMSDADIDLANSSATPNQISMDPSIPNLPAKAKEDFAAGRQLLEVSPLVRYDTTRFDISTAIKDLSTEQFRSGQSIDEAIDAFKPLDEIEATARLESHFSGSSTIEPAIVRLDYSLAFDPIAVSEKTMAAGYLDPSVFDGTMRTITLDIAPYIRSVVAYDQRLQQNRLSRSSLLSEGGQPGKKRIRTTRSAYSALEGNSRASTRRERYFTADINPYLVLRTGGKGWDTIAASIAGEQNAISNGTGSPGGESEENMGNTDQNQAQTGDIGFA